MHVWSCPGMVPMHVTSPHLSPDRALPCPACIRCQAAEPSWSAQAGVRHGVRVWGGSRGRGRARLQADEPVRAPQGDGGCSRASGIRLETAASPRHPPRCSWGSEEAQAGGGMSALIQTYTVVVIVNRHSGINDKSHTSHSQRPGLQCIRSL